MSKIKIMIVDDHPVVRKGMIALLQGEADMDVVGECGNGAEALEQYPRLKPDIVLMDLVMPVMDGIEAIQRIRADHPKARILVLTSFTTNEKVFAAIKAGAAGYLLKDSDPEELIKAIHQVHRGESSLHPSIAHKLLAEFSQPAPVKNDAEQLTEREKEVLALIARGLSNQEIAAQMVVSPATIHSHVSRILAKLQVSSRTQAALFAIREGYITFGNKD
ncbi:MAG: response regulator transcription factor [Anaerolineaceae bacterium]|nr:response regulator transcription factor [Anaerolineaceae bacterium]